MADKQTSVKCHLLSGEVVFDMFALSIHRINSDQFPSAPRLQSSAPLSTMRL